MSDSPEFTFQYTYKGVPVKDMEEMRESLSRYEESIIRLTDLVEHLFTIVVNNDRAFISTPQGEWIKKFLTIRNNFKALDGVTNNEHTH